MVKNREFEKQKVQQLQLNIYLIDIAYFALTQRLLYSGIHIDRLMSSPALSCCLPWV